MTLTATFMAVIEATWQVSAGAVKYLLLALLLFGAYRLRPGNVAEARKTLRYSLKQLILHRKQTLVYSLIGGGIVLAILPSQPVSAYIATGTGFGYALAKIRKDPPEPEERNYRRIMTVFMAALLISVSLLSIAAVATNIPLLNHLAALYLYSLVFWKL